MSTALNDQGLVAILREREEQLEKHGYSAEHDDTLTDEQLLGAAMAVLKEDPYTWPKEMPMEIFRNASEKGTAERLAVAGALVAAEITRVLRARERGTAEPAVRTLPKDGTRVQVRPNVYHVAVQVATSPSYAEQLATLIGMRGQIVAAHTDMDVDWAEVRFDGLKTTSLLPLRALRFLNDETNTQHEN